MDVRTCALLDSNSLIYLSNGKIKEDILAPFSQVFYSVISRIEVFGFQRMAPREEEILASIVKNFHQIELTSRIVEDVIAIRRSHRVAVPDAIVAATARVHGLVLITADMRGFPALLPPNQLLNPLFTS